MSQFQQIRVDEVAMARAAHRLTQEGLWVRRDFWVDPEGCEVPEGDPAAVNMDYLMEVDYDRIVALVVESLSEPGSPSAVAGTGDGTVAGTGTGNGGQVADADPGNASMGAAR